MKRTNSFSSKQKGSFLLEGLIAILLFAIGILGMVGLLGTSIRATNDARYRSEAANLANGMVADMWSVNAAQLDTYFGSGGTSLAAWQVKAASLLPSADVNPPTVDLTQPGLSLQSRTVVVRVFWQLPGSTELHSYMLTAQIGKNS